MITLFGRGDISQSEQTAEFAFSTMIPLLKGNERVVVAQNLYHPLFQKHPAYRDVTRDPEDTIAHDHDRHVLLMRSDPEIRDATLLFDAKRGWRALHEAIVKTRLQHKLELAMLETRQQIDELLEGCINGCELLRVGVEHDLLPLMHNGAEAVRNKLAEYPGVLFGEIKYELYKTLVLAQQEIPHGERECLVWDSENIDAVLIGAGSGHARSLLDVDVSEVSKEELDAALGIGGGRGRRGLHFASFETVE